MTEPLTEHIAASPPETPPRPRRYRNAATAMAACLLVLIAAAATAPFWALPLATVLPWGKPPGPDPQLVARLARLEAAQRQQEQAAAQHASSQEQLGKRVAQLEATQSERQQNAAKALSVVQQLNSRIAALEAADKREQQNTGAAESALKQIERRIAALEARPEPSAKDVNDLRQQIEKMSAGGTDLAARIDALEKAVRAQSQTDPSNAAMLLALMQIQSAVQIGRPFTAEYDALTALARNRSAIADAAKSLAEPAKAGVATHAVLAKRLHELAGAIAEAREQPAADADWGSAALARLRGLVTIRRVAGAAQSGPEAAVGAAEASLAAGDLAGAVAALDKLGGPAAEKARPWLQTARERLAVESALRQIETSLTADLGKSANPAAAAAPRG